MKSSPAIEKAGGPSKDDGDRHWDRYALDRAPKPVWLLEPRASSPLFRFNRTDTKLGWQLVARAVEPANDGEHR